MIGKRGNELRTEIIFDALFIVAFLFSMYAITGAAIEVGTDWQSFHAKDVSLLIDVFHASPGDVRLTYPLFGAELYDVTLEKNRFELSKQLENRKQTRSAIFGTSFDKTVLNTSFQSAFLILSKEGNTISLAEDTSSSSESSSCPQVETSRLPADTTIFFHAPDRFLDPLAATQLEGISELTSIYLKRKGFVISEANPSLIIDLSYGEGYLVLSSSTPGGSKLGCLFLQQLEDILPFVGEQLSEEQTHGANNIQLVFGDQADFEGWEEDRATIAQGLYKAILDYYGVEP